MTSAKGPSSTSSALALADDGVGCSRRTGGAEGAPESAAWAETAATKTKPTKSDQDQLDAYTCLVSALHLAKGRDALFVGCCATGYIVVPDSEMLRNELERSCGELGRESAKWVRVFRLPAAAAAGARQVVCRSQCAVWAHGGDPAGFLGGLY